jgi:hypothetical protein
MALKSINNKLVSAVCNKMIDSLQTSLDDSVKIDLRCDIGEIARRLGESVWGNLRGSLADSLTERDT